jgi:hypothetical protein
MNYWGLILIYAAKFNKLTIHIVVLFSFVMQPVETQTGKFHILSLRKISLYEPWLFLLSDARK